MSGDFHHSVWNPIQHRTYHVNIQYFSSDRYYASNVLYFNQTWGWLRCSTWNIKQNFEVWACVAQDEFLMIFLIFAPVYTNGQLLKRLMIYLCYTKYHFFLRVLVQICCKFCLFILVSRRLFEAYVDMFCESYAERIMTPTTLMWYSDLIHIIT